MFSERFLCFILLSSLLTSACSDSSDSKPEDSLPIYDFTAVDARLQGFVDETETFEGISITLVDSVQGEVHKASFGDHAPDIVVALAAVSQLTTASLLIAIDEDETIDFDIDTPVGVYLPWEGVYGDPTTAQLIGQTSGIPGIIPRLIFGYGVHDCQYDPDYDFEECAKLVFSTELPGSNPPGTVFDHGGSQWYLAGAVAMQVTNSEWNQLFDEYVAQPCGLEVYKYGNTANQREYGLFTGDPNNLAGTGNPHAGGGAISNLQDMGGILLMHLREGMCGDNRVLSSEAVSLMRVDRTEGLTNLYFPGRSYGLGWWMREEQLPGVIYDGGVYGSVVWIDTRRMVGGFVAVDDYSETAASDAWDLVLEEIIPLVGEIVDDARLEVGE